MAPDPADPAAAVLAGWREAEQAAAEGPWRVKAGHLGGHPKYVTAPDNSTVAECWMDDEGLAAGFIVTARTAMPLLLDAVERALGLHRRSDEPVKTRNVCRRHAYAHHPSPQWRAEVDACPDCTVTEKWVCAEPSCRHECPDDDGWPCLTVRAITAALTGAPGDEEREVQHGMG